MTASHRLTTLLDLRYQNHYEAEEGRHGGGSNCTGRSGEDLTITVPVGTIVYDDHDFTWHELATTDVDGAFRFYGALFGWAKVESIDMGEMGMYHMFAQSEGTVCGGVYLKPAEVPFSNWLPYASVPSADEAAEVVTDKGGTILVPPMEVPGGDRVTILMDPQGAVFAVHAKGR